MFPFRRSIEKEGELDHSHTILRKTQLSDLSGLVVDEIDICTRLVDPADEKVAFEHIVFIVILEIGFDVQFWREGIDDPGGSDVCAELAAFSRQVEIVVVIDEFDVEMFGEFKKTTAV
jgi:hypothetical protein